MLSNQLVFSLRCTARGQNNAELKVHLKNEVYINKVVKEEYFGLENGHHQQSIKTFSHSELDLVKQGMKEGFTLIKVLLPVDPSSSRTGLHQVAEASWRFEALEQICTAQKRVHASLRLLSYLLLATNLSVLRIA
ncbi:Uncharacterized protein LW93_5618 [Fusarium fujikuroi]|nr:Uncharacterized protein LW93_5618 [Fusarium fujikuroi]